MSVSGRPHLPPLQSPSHRRHGRLEVICGCMFSGKSEELVRRCIRADIAKQRVIAVKPLIDQRYSATAIVSHAGRRWPSMLVESSELILPLAEKHDPDVLAIEEAQFFDKGIVRVAERLVERGIQVICAGLDLDALARPFGAMPDLICNAETVTKLSAVCVVCGEEACRSQLLVDGEPLAWRDGPLIVIAGAESYEARCRACFELPGRPD